MISIDNITVSFGSFNLFKGITFNITPRDRIGLVGRNGAGKTTLLKVIIGEQPPTDGVVSFSDNVTLGYLPQQMQVADTTTLFDETEKAFEELLRLEAEMEEINKQLTTREDYESDSYERMLVRLNYITERIHILGGDQREAEIEKVLIGLGFERSDFQRPTKEFSGGWRMRIELAKILLQRPSTLLLDEPTNHLDIESIGWLESYLRDYEGSVVLISHDRAFLDNVTNRTVEISLGEIYDYNTNYTHFMELRKERRQQQMAAYENQQRMIEKTEEFIDRFRYQASKATQVQSRIKHLEKLDIIEIDDEDTSDLHIKFPPAPHSGRLVAEVKEAGKSFGEHHVFSGANFVVERGDKIAFVGRNGEGKTTLARMLVGELDSTEGEIKIGHNIKTGYYAQNQERLLDGSQTVYETLDWVAVGDIRTRLRDILAAFLFRGDDIDKRVSVLSGGERARLALAKMMLEPHNLLIMDEPTNHMDMRSKDILKSALNKYDGTLIVVSHDRDFLDGLVDKVYEFRDGGVREHLGGIYDFLEYRKMESLQEIERRDNTLSLKTKQAGSEELSGREAYEKQQEVDRVRRRAENRVKQTEREITKLEKEIEKWDAKIAEPEKHELDLNNPKTFDEYNRVKKKLEIKLSEWEQFHKELEEIQKN